MEEFRMQARLQEWAVKNISSMFVTMADSKKQAKAISKMVESMKIPLADEVEPELTEDELFELIENGAQVDLTNQPAFEALDAMFRTDPAFDN